LILLWCLIIANKKILTINILNSKGVFSKNDRINMAKIEIMEPNAANLVVNTIAPHIIAAMIAIYG